MCIASKSNDAGVLKGIETDAIGESASALSVAIKLKVSVASDSQATDIEGLVENISFLTVCTTVCVESIFLKEVSTYI